MRVIVTVTRDWDDFSRFSMVMDEMLFMSQAICQDLVVAESGSGSPLHTWAREWAVGARPQILTYPGSRYLIEDGGDMCVVFLRTPGVDTMDLISRARHKGIWTVIIHWDGEELQVPAPVFQLPIPAPWPNLEVPDASLLKAA